MDDLSEQFLEVVKRHYENSDRALLVSLFGQTNSELRQELISKFGSIANTVNSTEGQLEIVVLGGIQGKETLVFPFNKEALERSEGERRAVTHKSAHELDKIPLPVQLAFCVRAEADEIIAVRVKRPSQYRKFATGETIPQGFSVVDERFRHPGLLLKAASESEKERIYRSYLSWLEDNKIKTDTSSVLSEVRRSALDRLLEAQERGVLAKIVIPADIIEMLSRER